MIAIAQLLGYKHDKAKGAINARVVVMRKGDTSIAVYPNQAKPIFIDRNTDEKGDRIALVMRELSCGYHAASAYINDALQAQVGAEIAEAKPKPKPKTNADFNRVYEESKPASESEYLISRGLEPCLLEHIHDARASGTEVFFFYRDDQGEITGYERKSPQFKGLASGSVKSLFSFDIVPDEAKAAIVVCESAIDAISYAHLLLASDAACVSYIVCSTGGVASAYQVEQINSLISKHSIKKIVMGHDADDAGDAQAENLTSKLRRVGLSIVRHRPRGAKDWNDQLVAAMINY